MDLLALTPIVERLSRAACPSLRLVGTAADLAAASASASPASPGAYVVLLGAVGEEQHEGSGPLRQSFAVTVAVMLRVRLVGADGANGLKLLETPAGEVRAALFGWLHPDAELKFEISGESLEDFDPKAGVLLYRLDFITRVRLVENLS